jgi:diguanylate cyclase (GGDEF)-like protein
LTIQQVDELRMRIESVVRGFSLSVRAQTRANVGISIGASVFGPDGETLDQLLIAADQAMYRAKNAHKTAGLAPLPPERLLESSTGRPAEILPDDFITFAIN